MPPPSPHAAVAFPARLALPPRAPRVRAATHCTAQAGGAGGPPSPGAPPPPRLLCFGLGYTALGLCNILQQEGWEVAGTVRDKRRRDALGARGFPAHLWDPDNDVHLGGAGHEALKEATHILVTTPPADLDRDPVIANLQEEIVRRAEGLQWVGYLSSTGVYGDWGGEWVTESSAPRPARRAMEARLEAEAAWADLGRAEGIPVHVFRLGGIYGPGRSALDVAAQRGPPRESQSRRGGRRFTSRVHVGDVCGAMRASMRRPQGGEVFNLVDNNPAPRKEVVAFARGLLGISPEGGGEGEGEGEGGGGEAGARSGGGRAGGEEKRVRNEKAREMLGWELRYPDYQAGLSAIHAGDDFPFHSGK